MTRPQTSVMHVSPLKSRAKPTNITWFAFSVLAGSLIVLVEYSLLGRTYPVEWIFRLAVLGQVALACAGRSSSSGRAARSVQLSIAALLAFSAITLFVSTARGLDRAEAVSSYLFMYNLALVLGLFLLTSLQVHFGPLFRIFSVSAVALGTVQLLTQSLQLPPTFTDHFGIVFQNFVNGDLRVLAFFASAPRYAEFLVVLALILAQRIYLGAGSRVANLSGTAVLLVLLYNTYSRSGFILGAVSLTLLTIHNLRRARREHSGFGFPQIISIIATATIFVLLTTGSVRQSTIADATSLAARNVHWNSLLTDFREGGPITLLFGTGLSAHYSFLSPQYFVVDNVVLAVMYHSGMLGLFAFLALLFAVLAQIRRAAHGQPTLAPLLCLYVGLMVEGMFVDNHNTILLATIVILGVLGRSAATDCSEDHVGSRNAKPEDVVSHHPRSPQGIPLEGNAL